MFSAEAQYVLIQEIKGLYSDYAYLWEVPQASRKKSGAFRTQFENVYLCNLHYIIPHSLR